MGSNVQNRAGGKEMICQKENCYHYGTYRMITSGQSFTSSGEIACYNCLHSIVDVDKLNAMVSRFIERIDFKEPSPLPMHSFIIDEDK
jgi:hypothetical protein